MCSPALALQRIARVDDERHGGDASVIEAGVIGGNDDAVMRRQWQWPAQRRRRHAVSAVIELAGAQWSV